MNELINVKGIRGRLNANGEPELYLEDVARELGFTRIADSGNTVIRWERVRGYLEGMGVPTCGHDGNSPLVGKEGLPEFISESILYKLCFKAENEKAINFQNLVTEDILPTIRKTGMYLTNANSVAVITAGTGYIKEIRRVMERQGNTPSEIAGMVEIVCRQLKLPLPLNFRKEPPFEQMTLTINYEKV